MKSKKIYLLLLLGAAVILTVIWTTRGVSKPSYSTFLTSSASSETSISTSVPNYLVEEFKNVTNSGLEVCPTISDVRPVIDTAEIYPTLNFNVSFYKSIWRNSTQSIIVKQEQPLLHQIEMSVSEILNIGSAAAGVTSV